MFDIYTKHIAFYNFIGGGSLRKRVFILGPSHHVYLQECSLTSFDEWETPLGNLIVDKDMINELVEKEEFVKMTNSEEEDEHSLEMQVPFLAHVFSSKLADIKIVPIVVGNLSSSSEHRYGRVLSEYLANEENFFIVSSDFCHWGSRFEYMAYSADPAPSSNLTFLNFRSAPNVIDPQVRLFQSITNLDHEAFDSIMTKSNTEFRKYLRATKNTICGRHAISVLLAATEILENKEPETLTNTVVATSSPSRPGNDGQYSITFLDYTKSSNITSIKDSSVSYAAGVLY
ncbi:Protein MEMO1-like protein [Smittium culicis]|uniref:Protein MEMO1-like protein n=1 Tax=Smittium culicis TaxID=133412 RepID=A0A1R1YPC2_9FUNG|nr:Protein MEMO1-like protein [Smittium culicis]